ncbi:MAG: PQQ-like beta-propeller repeat protein, partial [Candidatus Bathyarchaeota archaeon]|nr:PQQ-like beta-propeller repeat protein [Candidatus Bathyarchaeota archaeon]
FGTTDNYLYAINASNSLYIWRYTAPGPIYSSPTISEDLLYFGCDDGKVYALNITGSLPGLKWFYTTPGGQRVRGTIAVYGDRIFFGSYTTDNAVFALDKTSGIWIWTCEITNNWQIENSVAVADGIVYVIPSQNNAGNEILALYANAESGTYASTDPAIRKWSTTIGYGGVNYGSEPVVADDKVLFSHYSASMYRVSALHVADGSTIWSYAFPSGYIGRPVIADGRLFMVRNKYVYCFGSPYPPVTYHYPVSAGGQNFDIMLSINATPGELDTSALITLKKISYTLEGIPGTIGMSNITIPNQMLSGPYTVTVDGGLPLNSASPIDNGTHTSLYFNYFQSIHTVEITGSTVIPEFSSAIILPLLVILTLIAALLTTKKLRSN